MGIPIGVLVLALGGGTLAIWITSPPAPEDEPVAVRDIPEDWLTPAPPEETDEAPAPPELAPPDVEEEEVPVDPPEPEEDPPVEEDPTPAFSPLSPFDTSGTLAFSSGGRDLGRETYQLEIGPDGVTLSSEGYFSVRVVLVNVRARFTQETVLDSTLRASSYSLDMNVPLGRSFSTSAHIDGQRAVITADDEQRETPVDPGPALMLGMFSSYTMLPALVAGHPDGAAEYPVLMLGRNASEEAEPADSLPVIRIEHQGEQRIFAGDRELTVDLYLVRSDVGDAMLFARGREFLGLHMGEGDESIRIHRADYFPDGFRLAR